MANIVNMMYLMIVTLFMVVGYSFVAVNITLLLYALLTDLLIIKYVLSSGFVMTVMLSHITACLTMNNFMYHTLSTFDHDS